MAKINAYNFFRWTNSTPSTDQPPVPWSYYRDRGRCFMPLAYPSEAMAFYLNTFSDVGLNYTDFPDIRLAVVNASTGVVANANAGTLVQHYLDAPTDTIYNIYCTLVVPTLPDGVYYFRIYRLTGTVTLCESSYFQVSNDKARLDITSALFKFRHDRYFYGIGYVDIPDFYQIVRLPCSIVERQLEGDKEVYKEVTTGRQRTFNNLLSRYIKMEMYYLDQDAHEAAGIMFDHENLTINGVRYRPKIAYKELTNPLSATTKGEIELWDDAFASANRC